MSMSVQDWLARAKLALQAVSESAAFDAALLLAHVIGLSPTQQRYHNPMLSAPQLAELAALLSRRQLGEPIAYILGHQPFYDLDFKVNADTLIPRPETEHLLELALAQYVPTEAVTIADLGTGSGALAISFAKHRPLARVFAVDVSAAALSVARENARDCAVDNVYFVQGDWLAAFAGQCLDGIISNPPYIEAHDAHLADLRFEPRSALVAADEGYADLFAIVQQAERVLKPTGCLMLEHGFAQGARLREFARQRGQWDRVETHHDFAGHERVTSMQLC